MKHKLLFTAFILLATAALVSVVPPTAAKDAPLFQVGHTYGLITGCVPVSPPCYGEKVKVVSIRADGWIEGQDVTSKQVWLYNPAQIISFMEFKEELRAER